MNDIALHASWKNRLNHYFESAQFEILQRNLNTEIGLGKLIYPPAPLIFNAFNLTPFEDVKVVLLGQDPYHQPNQAMGLSFSVPRTIRVPASLKNIYKELAVDVDFNIPSHGDLTSWAEQGVLLLNAFLTVEHGKAGSHRKLGWQYFTDTVIQLLNEHREGVVFLLWGNFAKQKKELIDTNKHHVLEAAHPSPLARNAFVGNKHFSKTNAFLRGQQLVEINWQLPL